MSDGRMRSTEVLNPATQELLGTVPDMGSEEIRAVLDDAPKGLVSWGGMTPDARADILAGAARLLELRAEDLGDLITRESGKPMAEGRGEARVSAQFLRWNAEEARRTYGRTIPSPNPQSRYLTVKQPVGVVAAITPWNFPALMIVRKAGAALAAGCSVVLRPATDTPLSALFIQAVLLEAGVMPEAFQVVTNEDPIVIGDMFTAHPAIAKLTFTGSTAVGRELASRASRHDIRVALELGGHAPFLVFPDADIDQVTGSIIGSRFRNTGQSCISTNRLLVHEHIADQLKERVAAEAAGLVIGNGIDPDVRIGPLIHARAAARFDGLRDDAVRRGATVLTGGGVAKVEGCPGAFREPTVLDQVPPDSHALREEVFGPMLSITSFGSVREAVDLANATPYGLASYVFTRDLDTAWHVAEQLQFGLVGVNDIAPSSPGLPFGGVKASGVGLENGPEGVDAFTTTKSICMGLGAPTP